MRTILPFVLLTISIVLVQNAFATTCILQPPQDAVNIADLIFAGEVVSRDDFVPTGLHSRTSSCSFAGQRHSKIRYRVTHTWKGECGNEVEIEMLEEAVMKPWRAEAGSRVVVYARMSNGVAETGICLPNKPIDCAFWERNALPPPRRHRGSEPLGPVPISKMIDALQDERWDLSYWAMRALAHLEESRGEILEALDLILEGRRPGSEVGALRVMLAMPEEPPRLMEYLTQATQNPQARVRAVAIASLARRLLTEAADLIAYALTDEDAWVRETALRHIAYVVPESEASRVRLAELVALLLADELEMIRLYCTSALERLGITTERVMLALEKAAASDVSRTVRVRARRAIEELENLHDRQPQDWRRQRRLEAQP